MNTRIDVYKNGLRMTDQQAINSIKKSRYILSMLNVEKEDIIDFCLGNLIIDKENSKDVLEELKKLINMTIYMIQTDKIAGCVLTVDSLMCNKAFRGITDLIKISGITNKFTMTTKKLSDDDFFDRLPRV